MSTEFTPANPDYGNRVRESFARQSAMTTMGIELADLGPGWIELILNRDENLTQQHGFVHAGVVATAMDSACGYAAFSLMPADAAVLTAEYKINLLRPAKDDRFLVRGWVVKPGATLTVAQASAAPIESSDPVAVMTATIMAVEGRGLDF